jgi:pyruvate kinase
MAQERTATLVVTLGPASLRPAVLRSLAPQGVDLLRLNLSHTALGDVDEVLRTARIHSQLPVCLDTEGAQVRVGLVATGVSLRVGQPVRLVREKALGTERQLSLRPAALFDVLEPGATVAVDEAVLRVAVVERGHVTAIVVSGGRVRSNRAAVLDPAPALPALTVKDHTALEIAVAAGVGHFALGYTASAAAVKELRALVPAGARVLARIDSRAGVERRGEIIAAADVVVVGRHHLAAEIPIEEVPFLQKAIAREGIQAGTPVWVAIGRSGEAANGTSPATVAEANDIANLLLDQVSGLVLTGETAVGADPFAAVERVSKLLQGFRTTARQEAPEASRAG